MSRPAPFGDEDVSSTAASGSTIVVGVIMSMIICCCCPIAAVIWCRARKNGKKGLKEEDTVNNSICFNEESSAEGLKASDFTMELTDLDQDYFDPFRECPSPKERLDNDMYVPYRLAPLTQRATSKEASFHDPNRCAAAAHNLADLRTASFHEHTQSSCGSSEIPGEQHTRQKVLEDTVQVAFVEEKENPLMIHDFLEREKENPHIIVDFSEYADPVTQRSCMSIFCEPRAVPLEAQKTEIYL